MADAYIALGPDGMFAEFVFQFHVLRTPPGIDSTASGCLGLVFGDVVHSVIQSQNSLVLDGQFLLLVYRTPMPDTCNQRIIAVYTSRLIVAYTCGAVIGVGVCQGIDRCAVCLLYGEVALL